MTFRNLDANHDWMYGSGRNNYVDETREIALNIETRVLSFEGDCFFATNAGIDWFNLLDYNRQEELENAVQQTIAQTPGVTAIKSVDAVLGANRKLTLQYTVEDIYSQSYSGSITPINQY